MFLFSALFLPLLVSDHRNAFTGGFVGHLRALTKVALFNFVDLLAFVVVYGEYFWPSGFPSSGAIGKTKSLSSFSKWSSVIFR